MHLKIDFRNKANSEKQSAGGKKTGSNSAGASIRVIHVQAFYLSLTVDLSKGDNYCRHYLLSKACIFSSLISMLFLRASSIMLSRAL